MYKVILVSVLSLVFTLPTFAQVSGGGGNLPTLPSGRSAGYSLNGIGEAQEDGVSTKELLESSFTVNGPFYGTLIANHANKTSIYQVNKYYTNPDFQFLNGSSSAIDLLNRAYELYNLNPKSLNKLSVLLKKMNMKPSVSQLQELEALNFKIGFSGSKSFLIDENSKYIVPLN